jgi:signal transduction histidine kinase
VPIPNRNLTMAAPAAIHREGSLRAVRLGVWVAGTALCGGMLIGAIRGHVLPLEKAVVHYSTGVILITVGLLVWARRPESRTGILLTAVPFVSAVGELPAIFPTSAVVYTVGLAVMFLGVPIFAQVVLSYPTGRLNSRLDRRFVATTYGVTLVYGVLLLLFYDPRAPHDPDIWEWPLHAVPFTHVGWLDLTGPRQVLDAVLFVLVVFFVALLIRKLVRATPAGRRVVLPLIVATSFVTVQFAVQVWLWLLGSSTNFWTSSAMFWSETITTFGILVALAGGVLWGRSARAAVADLVVELERTPPGSVRDVLARTLGDPSLELALWLPERGSYVDGSGGPLELPGPGSDRAVTVLGVGQAPVAALVHDPALLERGSLLEAAGAAARLALENERLQAELRSQLAELRASRARILIAGDEERRRLERDLHDGAQQRLLGLGLALQLARARVGEKGNGAAELLSEADAELRAALQELRELARGIHPAILIDQGLEATLRSLAERSSVQVTILVAFPERLGEPVEAAIYFLVSESLANVAKHAHASMVRIAITREERAVVVSIKDDGVGGADPMLGSGLRGLGDRIHALDGTLRVVSPPGQGTRIEAFIPCGW